MSPVGAVWWQIAHRRLVKSDMERLIDALPERYVFTANGIEAHFADGIKISGPWSTFAAWQE